MVIRIKIANQKSEIQNQLQIARDFADQRRLDRIAQAENQIAIARASKIFDRKLSSYTTTMASQSAGVTLNTAQEPLYMRGVKEFTAEKAELEKRKNDEPFIDGFRDKQECLAQLDAGLKQLQSAKAIATAVIVDQPAIQAKKTCETEADASAGLECCAWGGIIGVFVAFVVNFVQQQKAKIKD